jgi:hypothetical protein
MCGRFTLRTSWQRFVLRVTDPPELFASPFNVAFTQQVLSAHEDAEHLDCPLVPPTIRESGPRFTAMEGG